jgi:type II restriction/modification system DNA methylase subunit YeeA
VSVQIGYLQWLRDNGFPLDRSPVLQNLDGFHNEDALLVPHFHSKAKTLKEAQKQEHEEESALKFYTEREWPKCDVIVSNPPFLGDKVMRRELGDGYVEELRRIYGDRIPGQSDLCCYWFEKARQQIESGEVKRAGMLATQGIRHGANREVLKRIKETGDIFFAISDREWILSGANVNVSMVGFDNASEKHRFLDGKAVEAIHSNLRGSETSEFDITSAQRLSANEALCFVGVMKGGPFDLPDVEGKKLLFAPNPHGKPNSDVLRPRVTAFDILRRGEAGWIIDFGVDSKPEDCAGYEAPWKHATEVIKPVRDSNRRKRMAQKWWIHGESRPGMRRKLSGLSRILITPEVSKHRIFVWLPTAFLPDHKLRAVAFDSDCWFGVLHSRIHEVWALKQGGRLQTRPCYTPSTCFETFPFPRPTPKQETAIAAAAKELNALRERWLNPPEWTRTEYLEFPASVDGPWSRYVDCGGNPANAGATPLSPAPARQSAVAATALPAQSKIGLARYPRLEPRDADCAAKLKDRTLTKLYNERPAWLDLAHKKLDTAVAAAYGFPADLTDEQILEKLLALNLARAAEEAKAAKVKKPKTSREKHAEEML